MAESCLRFLRLFYRIGTILRLAERPIGKALGSLALLSVITPVTHADNLPNLPTRIVTVATNSGRFKLPYLYLAHRFALTLKGDMIDGTLDVAFVMPTGDPLREDYGKLQAGVNPPEIKDKSAYPVRATVLGDLSDRSNANGIDQDPAILFRNAITPTDTEEFNSSFGMLKAWIKGQPQTGLVYFFGRKFFPEYGGIFTILLRCFEGREPSAPPLCSGVIDDGKLKCRYFVEFSREQLQSTFQIVSKLHNLVSSWQQNEPK